MKSELDYCSEAEFELDMLVFVILTEHQGEGMTYNEARALALEEIKELNADN